MGRLWVENLRIDEATLIGGVRVNIWMSLVIIAGGLLWLFWGGSPVDRDATELLRGGADPAELFAHETSFATPELASADEDSTVPDDPEEVSASGTDPVGEDGPEPD
jgi:hypothetical protein